MTKDKANKIVQAINIFLGKYGLFCFAAVVCVLNYSLAFDNVVWGDEAFSGTVIRDTDFAGIMQRVYYWDAHPPVYYYWLRIWADLFGYTTPVYHWASLFPFTLGIIIAVTVFKKYIGQIPAYFFVLLSGLAAPCAEYNQEIRMYALVFLEILSCAYYSYRIISGNGQKRFWIAITLWGVAAAYTHYFGLVVSGLLLFVTALSYFLRERGKTWLYGVVSICSYIVLYLPWLWVFYRQAQMGSNWWREEISPLSVLVNMIFCGVNIKQVLLPTVLILTLVILVIESRICTLKLSENQKAIEWHLQKPNIKNWSIELQVIVLFWSVIILTVLFTYLASYLISSLTVPRYMYPLVPLTIFILMLCIRRLLTYGKVCWGNEEYCLKQEETNPESISLFDTESKWWSRMIFCITFCMFGVMLFIGLGDFKYYRSVSKTEAVQTQKIMEIIDEPGDNEVISVTGIKHLGWTVLPYYFPNNSIYDAEPEMIETDADEIWAFRGDDISSGAVLLMQQKGYSMEEYTELWLGKYACNLYHFYKEK